MTLSQREGPRTNELDQKLSVFEPEPEPYGVLPGIEEVLFSPVYSAINVRLEPEEVEGNQEEDICGIGDEQSQEEVPRQVCLWASGKAIVMLTAASLAIEGL